VNNPVALHQENMFAALSFLINPPISVPEFGANIDESRLKSN